ncbi:hypothetical protein [Geopseudomonas aromaticivorans]
MEYVRALEVSTAVPLLHEVQRPGCSKIDQMIILSLLGAYQRHLCRVTPVPPVSLAFWTKDQCLLVSLSRAQYLSVQRTLATYGYVFVSPDGVPKTLTDMDVAVFVPRPQARRWLDLAKAAETMRPASQPIEMASY